jgi:hypothetical protein
MNTLQRLTSKIDGTATPHLCEAAEILTRSGDMEAACIPLLDAALETLGDNPQLQAIVDFTLMAMSVQFVACWDASIRRKPA